MDRTTFDPHISHSISRTPPFLRRPRPVQYTVRTQRDIQTDRTRQHEPLSMTIFRNHTDSRLDSRMRPIRRNRRPIDANLPTLTPRPRDTRQQRTTTSTAQSGNPNHFSSSHLKRNRSRGLAKHQFLNRQHRLADHRRDTLEKVVKFTTHHQLGNHAIGRQLVSAQLARHATITQHHHTLSQPPDLPQLMSHEQDSKTISSKLLQHTEQSFRVDHPRRRLIKDEQVRRSSQRLRDLHQFTINRAQRRNHSRRRARNPHHRQQRLHIRLKLTTTNQTVSTPNLRKRNILRDTHVRHQRRFLRHQRNPMPQPVPRTLQTHGRPIDTNLARIRR